MPHLYCTFRAETGEEVLAYDGPASTEVTVCGMQCPVLRVLDENPPHIIHPLPPMRESFAFPVSLRIEPTLLKGWGPTIPQSKQRVGWLRSPLISAIFDGESEAWTFKSAN